MVIKKEIKSPSADDQSRWSPQKILQPLGELPPRERIAKTSSVSSNIDWEGRYGRDDRCFVDASGEPGPYLRWLCLLRLICQRCVHSSGPTAMDQWRSARDPLPTVLPDQADLDTVLRAALHRADMRAARGSTAVPKDWLRGPFRLRQANLWPAGRFMEPSEPIYQALDQCLREIRLSDGLPPIGLIDLLKEEFLHPGEQFNCDTVERLATWLECDFKPAQEDLSRLQGELYVEGTGSDREKHVQSLVERLIADSDTGWTGSQPLINVWSNDQRTGLRALATRLCVRVKEELACRPRGRCPAMIYIPLDRIPTESEDLRPSRRDVVTIILDCLGIRSNSKSVPSGSDIEQIQRALTERRVLLILDGIEIASPPFGALFDVIRATDWTGFVRTLIQPDDRALDVTSGQFRSRILALSNRPLTDLAAWMMTQAPEALPPIQGSNEMVALLNNSHKLDLDRRELSQKAEGLWPSPFARPQFQHSAHSLDIRFKLTKETASEVANEMKGMLNELDLTLAWCADQSKCKWPGSTPPRPWNQVSGDAWRMLILKTWLYDHNNRTDDGAWNSRGAIVAVQFIALSVNGLRLTTLDRALARFSSATTEPSLPESVAALRKMLSAPGGAASFAEKFWAIVDRHLDNDLIELPDEVRWFELQIDKNNSSGVLVEDGRFLLDLRSEKVREWIMADLLSDKDLEPRFRLINAILAEESIAQATAQARRIHTRAHDVLSLRRFLQAAFHGLMSLDLDSLDPDRRAPISAFGVTGNALPEDAYRRYVYLYEFVYRKCIENVPAWFLGRGIAREDVRSALLAMFANPGWARHVLATLYSRPEDERSFAALGAFRLDRTPEFRPAFDPRAPYLRGAIGFDLFNALMHSAFRSGRHASYARRADEIAAQLDGSIDKGPSVQARPANQKLGGKDFEFTKISIDALQAMSELDNVEVRCREHLTRLGAHLDWATFTSLGSALEGHEWSKASFENSVLVPVVEEICPTRSSQSGMEHISDVLFRIGELLATRADFQSDNSDAEAHIAQYANAYSVFWIGDRVRASSASSDLSEVSWPAVSARAMRYFVRVSLKLAKLIAKVATASGAANSRRSAEMALEFYGHARGRIDVYSRHLFRSPAEGVQVLLLLAAAARVRSSMSRSALAELAPLRSTQDYLFASYDYLSEARNQMIDNEFNRSILKRYLLERIKTFGKLGAWGSAVGGRPRPASFSMMARSDTELLARLSAGHRYWEEILKHMHANRSADFNSRVV